MPQEPSDDKVYAILMIDCSGQEDPAKLDIIGIYTDWLVAEQYITEVEKLDTAQPPVMYDVLEFTLNAEPVLLQFLRREQEIRADVIDKHLSNLMKEGLIEQFIGEDGHFYYGITELGQQQQTNIPAQIKKFFKKGE